MGGPDFSRATVDTLSGRAAGRCSNPDCGLLTIGPHSNDDKKLSIREAAHIYGARQGERRYRLEMTDVERATITNGIWLCRNCHGEIDRDPQRFPAELLFQWKALHEANILSEIGSSGEKLRSSVERDRMAPFSHLPAFIRGVIRDKPDYWEYLLTAELLDFYCSPILRRGEDLKRGVTLRKMSALPAEEFTQWLSRKPTELLMVPHAVEELLGDLTKAWGAPRCPGDDIEIERACRLFSDVAKYLVDIAEEIKFTETPEGFENLRDLLVEGSLYPIRRFSDLPAFLRHLVSDRPKEGVIIFDFILDFPEGWADRFHRESQKAIMIFERKGRF